MTTGNYERVREHHYIATADDDFLVSGWIDCNNVFHGKNRLGMKVHIPLGVPLCSGCCGRIEDGCCHSCEVVHEDVAIEPARHCLTTRAMRDAA